MGTVSPFRRFADGLANVLTGRGTSVDRQASNFWIRRFTTPDQVEAAYLSSWLHRKIVDVPAEDMTRAGRDWDADDAEIEKIEAEEKRLGYWAKLREAVRLARLGGGAIFIGIGDSDPSQPLPNTIGAGGVKYLMVLSRWQLTLGDLENDPASPEFMQPRFFTIAGMSGQVQIHPSRMVCFHGLPIPAIHMTNAEDRFWGMSVVEACDEPVQQATTACAGFASLIDEAKIDVYRFNGLTDLLLQPGGEDKLTTRVQATTTGKSVHRAVILDKEDEWDQRQLTLTGVRDVIITFDGRLAGAADMPATRLLGKSPDGQNSTGESDLANYFQGIGAKQEMFLRPGMERLDVVVLPSAGVKTDLTWQFSTLRVLTEKEAAEIENKEADTLTKLVNSGMFSGVALEESYSTRMSESQRWPNYKDTRDKQIKLGEFEPSDEPDESELGIVPIPNGTKGGGQTSIVPGGNAQQPPARRAANDWFADATPRPLYVQRKLLNAADLIKWAKAQGFTSTLPAGDMHVAVLFSRTAVDPMKIGEGWDGDEKGELRIKPGGPRAVERLGENAVVLLFSSWSLSSRHRDMVEAGGSHDFPEYQPHVTLSYEVPAGFDLDAVKPYTGALHFGPEVFEPLDLDWKSKVSEE